MTEDDQAAPLKSAAEGPPAPVHSRKSVARFWTRWLTPAKYRRLNNALRSAAAELDLRLSQETKEEARSALGGSRQLLEEARRALDDEGNDALGWLLLKEARRFQIYAMTETEAQARARSIVREAGEKLSSWRKGTIDDLLPEAELLCKAGDGGGRGFDHNRFVRVVYAAKILDEHHDNVYLKQEIVKTRLKLLAALALVVLLIWLRAEPSAGALATTASGAAVGPRFFWGTVFLAGVVGATISGFIFSINREGTGGIPQELQGSTITFARVALGALSALAVTALLNSGFLNLGKTGYEAALAVAVVSGFSERLLVRAVEAVSK